MQLQLVSFCGLLNFFHRHHGELHHQYRLLSLFQKQPCKVKPSHLCCCAWPMSSFVLDHKQILSPNFDLFITLIGVILGSRTCNLVMWPLYFCSVFLSGLWYFQLCPLKVVDVAVCCFGDFLYHAVAVLLTSTVAGNLNWPVGCLVVSTPVFLLLCWLCLMLVLWSISPFLSASKWLDFLPLTALWSLYPI